MADQNGYKFQNGKVEFSKNGTTLSVDTGKAEVTFKGVSGEQIKLKPDTVALSVPLAVGFKIEYGADGRGKLFAKLGDFELALGFDAASQETTELKVKFKQGFFVGSGGGTVELDTFKTGDGQLALKGKAYGEFKIFGRTPFGEKIQERNKQK